MCLVSLRMSTAKHETKFLHVASNNSMTMYALMVNKRKQQVQTPQNSHKRKVLTRFTCALVAMCRFGLSMIGRKNAFTELALEPLRVVSRGLITPANDFDFSSDKLEPKHVFFGKRF